MSTARRARFDLRRELRLALRDAGGLLHCLTIKDSTFTDVGDITNKKLYLVLYRSDYEKFGSFVGNSFLQTRPVWFDMIRLLAFATRWRMAIHMPAT